METVFGRVVFRRLGYRAAGLDSRFPLDAALNLPANFYSPELKRQVVSTAIRQSFGATVDSVDQVTAGHVPKRQAEALMVEASQDVAAFYAQQARVNEDSRDLLVLSMDGKGVVLHTEDLRPATREAAENKVHKLDTRLSPGEKRDCKRMATVAAVYGLARYVRAANDVLTEAGTGTPVKRPKPQNKRVWASLERESKEVIDEAFQEAQRRDPEHQRHWVVLVDGGVSQLKQVRACGEAHGVQITIVLDFIHVQEYLWKAAHALHPGKSEEAEAWVKERSDGLLGGYAADMMATDLRVAARSLKGSPAEAVENCARYLSNHRDYLHYQRYLQEGLPIATGVIEGACRYLVKDRLDITGARWRLKGAEAMLALRSVMASGDMDAYWAYHQANSFKRTHEARYQGTPWRQAA